MFKIKKYSKEIIIKQLKGHYSKNPQMTRNSFDRDKNTCSKSTIRLVFGLWENALKEAGISPVKKVSNSYISKKIVLKQLIEHSKKNPKITRKSFDADEEVCSADTVVARFGSWQKALEEAGIREKKTYVEYDKGKLLLILKNKVKTGELKYQNDIKKIEGLPTWGYISKFWTWEELVKLLGLKIVVSQYKDEEIIESYKKLKRRKKYQEKKISLSIFHRESGISNWTVKAHFGSWNKFLSMMNEEITLEQVKVTHTDEELLEMYRDFSVEIGKDGIGATAQEVNDHFIYNSNVLERRFKSLNKMRELLGYKPILRGEKYTKDILKEILLKKYEEYGRILSLREMHGENKKNKKSKLPMVSTFLKHFQTTKMSEVWEEVLRNKEIKEKNRNIILDLSPSNSRDKE